MFLNLIKCVQYPILTCKRNRTFLVIYVNSKYPNLIKDCADDLIPTTPSITPTFSLRIVIYSPSIRFTAIRVSPVVASAYRSVFSCTSYILPTVECFTIIFLRSTTTNA